MEDFHRYIYFYTLDHTGTYTTSGYSLPITPFTFIPVFDDGMSTDYSKQNILWDFGDGTTSQEITAVHHYPNAGWYNVKCFVLGKGGEGYVDKFSQLILVKNFISDTLVLSGETSKTQSGTLQNPFEVFRFNSWQTYSKLSGGYALNLSMTGNQAPILDVEKYKKDKWGHLKPSARFEAVVINPDTKIEERIPVNTLYTDNTEIYVKLDKNNNLQFCEKSDTNSCFAGSSGKKLFYFIDDIPKQVNDINKDPVTIIITFDTSKFESILNSSEKYPEQEYSVLNGIFDATSFKRTIEQLDSDHLTITSNGIDDDNNGNLINTFDIFKTKFTGQKIPFVVRMKSTKNGKELASKYNPVLTKTDTETTSANQIYIELRNEFNEKIEDVEIGTDFGVLSSETHGGYFKGYLKSHRELDNVYIFAASLPQIQEQFRVETDYAIIGEPESDSIHKIVIQSVIGKPKEKVFSDQIVTNTGLSGIYSSCLTYFIKPDESTEGFVWLVDADKQKIKKYKLGENLTLVFDNFILPENSSPSDISADSNGNVWVTLYDSISTVRINHITNIVDRTIVSSLSNTVVNDENSVSPASIDVDINDNVWISYSTQNNSFVEKYDINGSVEFSHIFTNGQATQIVTDLYGNLWGVLKDNQTSTRVLSSKLDKLFKIDSNLDITYYTLSGSLWNLTIDLNGIIWVTRNRNELVRFIPWNLETEYYTLTSNSLNSPLNYISDLEGIACTTDNNILVIDNSNKRLHYFNADIELEGFNPKFLQFSNVDLPLNRKQDKINGYGDWNGFKYINKNKLLHITGATRRFFGKSNTFSIFSANSGKYELEKVNENFDPKTQIMNYRFQDYLKEKSDKLFEDFIGTSIGTLSSNPTELGKLIYEKIANFTDNIANIDTCNVESLQSLYYMMDEDFYTFTDYKYAGIPAEINRLINIFSVKYSKLKGSRNKFDLNFDTKGYFNEEIIRNGGTPIYGINKGKELNFETTVLTAGKAIIAYEKFSQSYKLINTDVLSSNYINYIDTVNKTYALSTYHQYWGWGLSLPDTYNNIEIPNYYEFYEYIDRYSNEQSEGIINWQSVNTSNLENIESINLWNEVCTETLLYSLAKGLEVIKP
jgi:hypothetical protein